MVSPLERVRVFVGDCRDDAFKYMQSSSLSHCGWSIYFDETLECFHANESEFERDNEAYRTQMINFFI